MSDLEAERLIAAAMSRPPSPANEVCAAVSKAYSTNFRPTGAYRVHGPGVPSHTPVPMNEIGFDPVRLKAVADRIVPPQNWRHWLWERSPQRPEAMNAYSFLGHIFCEGESVLVFDRMDSKSPLKQVRISHPTDCRVPYEIRAGGRYGKGIWYLCNPVDGQWHPNPRQGGESCRSEEAITSFRYAVLESDEATADVWLAFIAQLPVRVAAIYTSGGRSLHTLIRLDAHSKAEWDSIIAPLKRGLKVLGADPACLSAVRLTRLPQCRRPEKNGFQKLLFLSPDPPLTPLIELPVVQSRAWTLARWRRVAPRWQPNTEAFA